MMTGTRLILTFDVGTTNTKSCLYSIGDSVELVGSSMQDYPIVLMDGGMAEQDPEDWITAMAAATGDILLKTGIDPDEIGGISFSSQMQGLVLVGYNGLHLRPAMSYMDQRAVDIKESFGKGITVDDLPPHKLLSSIRITGLAPTSVKDPLWKYLWVKKHEPEIFAQTKYWFDVKDYLIYRLTGTAVCTRDSACAAGLFDNRAGRNRWSKRLCKAYGVDFQHLPKIIQSHEIAGGLKKDIALMMGLSENLSVFGGGGDASVIGLGAGAVNDNQAHVYMGTSGWVSVVTPSRNLDIRRKIASITCAIPGRYHYFCEQETSGKCLEWVRDHLALDEIGVYMSKIPVTEDGESVYKTLFEYLNEVIRETPPGSDGVLFAPWLHGSRSPFEDPYARGMFFNIGLKTGKRDMIRSVVEGLAFNTRWMLESIERRISCDGPLRFVGGGALSPVTAQIFSDVTGRVLEVPADPHNAGTLGAAMIAAYGLGWIPTVHGISEKIRIENTYYPSEEHRDIYDRQYAAFRSLYKRNKKLFSYLNM